MYYVYILLSKKHAKTYTGITKNIMVRLKQHNSGYHVYTKRYVPWEVLYTETLDSRIDARKREKYLKSAAGRSWVKKTLFDD